MNERVNAAQEPTPERLSKIVAEPNQVRYALETIIEEGQVFEIKALGVVSPRWKKPHAEVGFFDNVDDAVRAVSELRVPDEPDSKLSVYVSANPLFPQILDRKRNRLGVIKKGTLAAADEGHVIKRTTLMIDIDPVRMSGIGSTKEELTHAVVLASKLSSWLQSEGWPPGVGALSGNGLHIIHRIDLPCDVASKNLIRRALKALSQKFSTPEASVDIKTWKRSQGLRLYGCMNGKGENSEGRPWRRSRLTSTSKKEGLRLVTKEQLEAVAALVKAPERKKRRARLTRPGEREIEAYDIAGKVLPFLPGKHKPKTEESGGEMYLMEFCPFQPNNKGHQWKAVVGQRGDGPLFAKCPHDSCSGNDWSTIMATYELGEADFMDKAPAVKLGGPDAGEEKREFHRKRREREARELAEEEANDRVEVVKSKRPVWEVAPSEASLCTRMLKILDCGEAKAVFADGELWRYGEGKGIWLKVTKQNFIGAISSWDGEILEDGKRVKINYSAGKGAYQIAEARRWRDGFFNHSERGFAAGRDFIRVRPREGVVEIVPLDHTHRIRAALDVSYNPDAKGPFLDKYLSTIHGDLNGDQLTAEERLEAEQKVTLLGEIIFSAMAQLGPYFNKAFILRDDGKGGTGKSQFLRILTAMIPRRSQSTVPIQKFSEEYWSAQMAGKLLNVIYDSDKNDIVREGAIKGIVSGDPQPGRSPRGEPFTWIPVLLLILAINGDISAPGATDAFWRRWIIMSFDQKFDGTEGETQEIGAIIAESERERVLEWAVSCGIELVKRGKYTQTRAMKEATIEAKRRGCSAAAWLEEGTEPIEATTAKCHWAKLAPAYKHYVAFCERDGYRRKLSKRPFTDRLTKMYGVTKDISCKDVVLMLSLKAEDHYDGG